METGAVIIKKKWHFRFGGNTMVRWSLTSSANYNAWVQGNLKVAPAPESYGYLQSSQPHSKSLYTAPWLRYSHAAPPCRQLSMMLMLAQSNPQLFALIGTQANVTKELERVEQQSRLEQLSPAELQSRNTDHWETWLQKYR